MNRFALGTVAVAALGILATTGCSAGSGHNGTAAANGGTSVPAPDPGAGGTTAPADGGAGPTGGTGPTTGGGGATTGTGGAGGAGGGATTGAGSAGGGTTTQRCHSRGLSASVSGYDAGAGNRYARLVFANISGQACKVYGFPGLMLGTGSEGFGGTTGRTGAATSFVIPAGGHAHTTLHWTAVPSADETASPCEDTATFLQVIPPDETTPVIASWGGGAVCGHNHLDTSALQPGA